MAIVLPIAQTLAAAALIKARDETALNQIILNWLNSEHRDAEEWAASEERLAGHPESADQYAAGYRDALTNVMNHLTGMGE